MSFKCKECYDVRNLLIEGPRPCFSNLFLSTEHKLGGLIVNIRKDEEFLVIADNGVSPAFVVKACGKMFRFQHSDDAALLDPVAFQYILRRYLAGLGNLEQS